jgi:hypothetical protein
MKQRVAEMEMEAEKLRQLQAAAESMQSHGSEETSGFNAESEEDKSAADNRSIYVGNVLTLGDGRECKRLTLDSIG